MTGSIVLLLLCGIAQAMEKPEGDPQIARVQINPAPSSSLLAKADAGIREYNSSLGIPSNAQPIAAVSPVDSLLEQALQGIGVKEKEQPVVAASSADSLLEQALKGVGAKENAKPANSLFGQALQGIKLYNIPKK